MLKLPSFGLVGAILGTLSSGFSGIHPSVVSFKSSNVFEIILEDLADSDRFFKPVEPLLSFREKTDRSRSIGTAFTLDGRRFISAWHVFNGIEGPRRYSLRGGDGVLHPLGPVLSFSSRRDFIVFSVSNPETLTPVPDRRIGDPKIDSTVYTIGNALGDGVILRDGLLTSLTPEEVGGEWRYIRFSAPASPGNSGGPLVDEEGRVLGIVVQRRNQGENLNVALPMSEVPTVDGVGELIQEVAVNIPWATVFEASSIITNRFSLPLDIPTLNRGISELRSAKLQEMISNLRSENRTVLEFKAKADLLNFTSGHSTFPLLYSLRKGEKEWSAGRPFGQEREPSWTNGSLRVFRSFYPGGAFCLRINDKDPDAVDRILESGDRLGEILAGTLEIKRPFSRGEAEVRTIGSPAKTERLRDRHGRDWKIFTFFNPAVDRKIILALIRTPEGALGFLWTGTQENLETHLAVGLESHLSQFRLTWLGSYSDWIRFLGRPAPSPLTSFRIQRENGGEVRLSLDGNGELLLDPIKFPSESDTEVRFYAAEGQNQANPSGPLAIREIGALHIASNRNANLAFHREPSSDASQEVRAAWSQLSGISGWTRIAGVEGVTGNFFLFTVLKKEHDPNLLLVLRSLSPSSEEFHQSEWKATLSNLRKKQAPVNDLLVEEKIAPTAQEDWHRLDPAQIFQFLETNRNRPGRFDLAFDRLLAESPDNFVDFKTKELRGGSWAAALSLWEARRAAASGDQGNALRWLRGVVSFDPAKGWYRSILPGRESSASWFLELCASEGQPTLEERPPPGMEAEWIRAAREGKASFPRNPEGLLKACRGILSVQPSHPEALAIASKETLATGDVYLSWKFRKRLVELEATMENLEALLQLCESLRRDDEAYDVAKRILTLLEQGRKFSLSTTVGSMETSFLRKSDDESLGNIARLAPSHALGRDATLSKVAREALSVISKTMGTEAALRYQLSDKGRVQKYLEADQLAYQAEVWSRAPSGAASAGAEQTEFVSRMYSKRPEDVKLLVRLLRCHVNEKQFVSARFLVEDWISRGGRMNPIYSSEEDPTGTEGSNSAFLACLGKDFSKVDGLRDEETPRANFHPLAFAGTNALRFLPRLALEKPSDRDFPDRIWESTAPYGRTGGSLEMANVLLPIEGEGVRNARFFLDPEAFSISRPAGRYRVTLHGFVPLHASSLDCPSPPSEHRFSVETEGIDPITVAFGSAGRNRLQKSSFDLTHKGGVLRLRFRKVTGPITVQMIEIARIP